VRDAGNELPDLITVLGWPWALSRKDLRELKLALDARGYSETSLASAWRDTTNLEMAALIMGWIRRAALEQI
jgi:type I restriction enzyme R subunit